MSSSVPPTAGTPGDDGPSEEEVRQYLAQMRGAPADQVLVEVVQGLLNAAQVKLGRNDARLLLDATAALNDTIRGKVDEQLVQQVDQALSQLRLAQVEAEREVAQAGQPEPNDLGAAPAGGQPTPGSTPPAGAEARPPRRRSRRPRNRSSPPRPASSGPPGSDPTGRARAARRTRRGASRLVPCARRRRRATPYNLMRQAASATTPTRQAPRIVPPHRVASTSSRRRPAQPAAGGVLMSRRPDRAAVSRAVAGRVGRSSSPSRRTKAPPSSNRTGSTRTSRSRASD